MLTGYETFIGYSDVKSLPVYFFVQKSVSQSVLGRVPFEVTNLDIGGAMNASSGTFTAPRSGIYSFAFTGLGYYPASTGETRLRMALMLNDSEIGRILEHTQEDGTYQTFSLNTAVELKVGDQVWLKIIEASNGVVL